MVKNNDSRVCERYVQPSGETDCIASRQVEVRPQALSLDEFELMSSEGLALALFSKSMGGFSPHIVGFDGAGRPVEVVANGPDDRETIEATSEGLRFVVPRAALDHEVMLRRLLGRLGVRAAFLVCEDLDLASPACVRVFEEHNACDTSAEVTAVLVLSAVYPDFGYQRTVLALAPGLFDASLSSTDVDVRGYGPDAYDVPLSPLMALLGDSSDSTHGM